MREIKRIRLGFENCEWMDFDATEIASIALEGITRNIRRYAINEISEMTLCSECFIELIPHANREHLPFGGDGCEATTTFKRIMEFDDIVSVEVFYGDGSRENVHVPWDDATLGGENNLNQESYLSDLGALYIYISRRKSLRSIVDTEEVNDQSYAQYLKHSLYM